MGLMAVIWGGGGVPAGGAQGGAATGRGTRWTRTHDTGTTRTTRRGRQSRLGRSGTSGLRGIVSVAVRRDAGRAVEKQWGPGALTRPGQ